MDGYTRKVERAIIPSMSPEQAPEHRLVKLHPHLEGKRILSIESEVLFDFPTFIDRLRLEKMELLFIPPDYSPQELEDYIKTQDIHAFVYHPIDDATWTEVVKKLEGEGFPMIMSLGSSVSKELIDLVNHLFSHIPSVRKGDTDFIEKFLDALVTAIDNVVAAKKH